jgi:2-polyprenyl-3-methyl-5-hydroxy-6-metoxy-1,4-benzoquinol methylase
MASVQAAINDRPGGDLIRSRPCPVCYLCGTRGEELYQGLRDRLFGAPGTWNFRRCPNIECGLIWLDPVPWEEDIGRAYATYYTHQQKAPSESVLSARRFTKSLIVAVYRFFLRLTLVHREQKQLACMYLSKTSPGRLLEVGCGDGSRLARLRGLGWEVYGQEMDPHAARYARSTHSIRVHLGRLEEAQFPNARFDAVIMNHVIEHVHDPVCLLRECNRLLSAGGTFVAVTPNAESYGHKSFRSSWRGLEPPRHLFLFSQQTLREVAGRAGFRRAYAWTTPAHAHVIVKASLQMRSSAKQHKSWLSEFSRGILLAGYQVWMMLVHLKDKNSGEECVLQATK